MSKKLKIFVSYSSSDREYLDDLLVHLKPYQRRGEVSIWEDHNIQPGRETDTAIIEAIDQATVALLLISGDFLASDYIYDKEIPRLLQRYSRNELVIVPLFVRYSNVKTESFFYTAKDGTTHGLKLTDVQGFRVEENTPDLTLDAIKFGNPPAYNRTLAKVANALATLQPDSNPRGDDDAPVPITARPTTAGRLILNVVFARSTEGVSLTRTITTATRTLGPTPIDVETVLNNAQFKVGSRKVTGVGAYQAAVAAGKGAVGIKSGGDYLTTLLLGPSSQHSNVLELITGSGHPPGHNLLNVNPRVRIFVDPGVDDATRHHIVSLPWRWASVDGNPLDDRGWTFEVVTEPTQRTVTLPQLPKTLVISDNEEYRANVRSMVSALDPRRGNNNHFCETSDLAACRDHTGDFRPDIVAIFVEATYTGNTWMLESGNSLISTETLDVMLASTSAIVVDLCVRLPKNGHRPSPLVLRNAACILVHPSTDTGDASLTWLRGVLRGLDPVEVLRESKETRQQSLVVATSYTTWLAPPLGGGPVLGLEFDRKDQRPRVAELVNALWRSETHRIHIVCVFGDRGNHVEHFSEQARHYLDTERADIPVVYVPAQVLSSGNVTGDLDNAVLRAIPGSKQSYHTLKKVLDDRVKAGSISQNRRILWLDLGILPGSMTWLTCQHSIHAVIDWTITTLLKQHIPDKVHIVVYFAMEISSNQHSTVTAWFDDELDRTVRDMSHNGVEITALAPLSVVRISDVRKLLTDTAGLHLPKGQVEKIAQAIMGKTDGRYEETLDEINVVARLGASDYLQSRTQ